MNKIINFGELNKFYFFNFLSRNDIYNENKWFYKLIDNIFNDDLKLHNSFDDIDDVIFREYEKI
jgi:hypothetical protein